MRLLEDGLPIIGSILAGGKERINGMYVLYTNDDSIPSCGTHGELDQLRSGGKGGYARVRITATNSDATTGRVMLTAMVTGEDCVGAAPVAGLTKFKAAIICYMQDDNPLHDRLMSYSGFVDRTGNPVWTPYQPGVYVVVNSSLGFGA